MKYSESDLVLRLENRIPPYYVSLTGQPKFYTLCSMFFEAAAIHANNLGYGYDDMSRGQVYWVLSRLQVIMHAYPRMDQTIIIETWPKGANKLFFMRDYRMLSQDNHLIAQATTAWLILDRNSGRPKKIEDAKLNELTIKDRHGIENLPGKLPVISEPDREESVKALYSDLDINNHVNAAKYIEWIQDCYDEELYKLNNVSEFQINYQLETRFAEDVRIRIKNLSKEDPYEYFEGIRAKDQMATFRARIRFDEFN